MARRIVAAAFVLFLLAEWGSHLAFHIYDRTPAAVAVSAAEEHRDDPCRSLVLCRDGRRDQKVANVGHDIIPQTALFERFSDVEATLASREGKRIPFGDADIILRPPEPPFHPPELT